MVALQHGLLLWIHRRTEGGRKYGVCEKVHLKWICGIRRASEIDSNIELLLQKFGGCGCELVLCQLTMMLLLKY